MTKSNSLLTGYTYDTEVQVVKLNQEVIAFWGAKIPCSYMVVTGITHNDAGYLYELIDIYSKEFHQTEHIYTESTHKGIGIYYDDRNPQFMDAEKVLLLKQEATLQQEQEEAAEQEEREHRTAMKKIGRERLEKLIPENAKAVIVAELNTEEDRRIVILGFSQSKRNNFAELRKFAAKFEPTKHLAEYNADYEDRDDYALGECYYGHWRLKKEVIYKLEYTLDYLSYTAGYEENICISEPTRTNTPKSPTKQGQYEFIDYSEKAIAIFGDTKPIKDQLSGLGGRFNKYLKYGDTKKAGWIFSKSKEDQLHKLLD